MRWWLAVLLLVLGGAALADIPTTGVQNGGGVLLLLPTGTVTSTPTTAPSGTVSGTPTITATATATPTPTLTPTFPFDWAVFVPSSGETIVADVQGDTATFTCSPPLVCTGTASSDTIVFAIFTFTPTSTFTATYTFTPTPTFTVTPTFTDTPTWTATATGTVTNTPTNTPTATATPTQRTYWSIFDPSTGSNATASLVADTALFNGTSPIVVTGDGSHTITWSWDFTVANTWTGVQTITTSGTTALTSGLIVTHTDNTALTTTTTGITIKANGGASATLPSIVGASISGDLSSNTNGFLVRGITGIATKSGSGTLLFLQGLVFGVSNGNASGLVTSAQAIAISDATDAGGGITTNIGLSIASMLAGGTNWEIQAGTAPSSFAGKIMLSGSGIPTNALDIDGQANRTVDVIRNVTAATAGKSLTVQAGGAVSGGGNLAGGTLALGSGITTGTGRSVVDIKTVITGGAAGDHSPATTAEFIDGHLEYTGTTPTVGTCGTSPAITGNDHAGTVTTGSTATTACTITWGAAWTNAPLCWAQSTGATITPRFSSTSTTTGVLAYASSTSQTIVYGCSGRQ